MMCSGEVAIEWAGGEQNMSEDATDNSYDGENAMMEDAQYASKAAAGTSGQHGPKGFVRKGGRPVTWIGGGGIDPKKLACMGVPQLRTLFAEVFGEATASNNAAWLRRKLAETPDETFGRGRCPTVRARDLGAAIWNVGPQRSKGEHMGFKSVGSTGQLQALAGFEEEAYEECAHKRVRRVPKRSQSCYAGSAADAALTSGDVFGRRKSEPLQPRTVLTWETFGDHLMGNCVEVYWPADNTWWGATVVQLDKPSRVLQLLYSNMQEEEISGDDLEGLIAVGHLSEGWADSTRPVRRAPRQPLSVAVSIQGLLARSGSGSGGMVPCIKEEPGEEEEEVQQGGACLGCDSGSPKRKRVHEEAAAAAAAAAEQEARLAVAVEQDMACDNSDWLLEACQAALGMMAPTNTMVAPPPAASAATMAANGSGLHPAALAAQLFGQAAVAPAPAVALGMYLHPGQPRMSEPQPAHALPLAACMPSVRSLSEPGCAIYAPAAPLTAQRCGQMPFVAAAGGGSGSDTERTSTHSVLHTAGRAMQPCEQACTGAENGAARTSEGWLYGALSHSEEESGSLSEEMQEEMVALEALAGCGGRCDDGGAGSYDDIATTLAGGDDCGLNADDGLHGYCGLFDY